MRFWPRRKVYVDDLPKTHDVRFSILLVAMFAAVLAGLYVVGYFVAGDRLPSGTKVAGVDVGGMHRDEAADALQQALEPRLDRDVKVTVSGQSFDLNPANAGIAVDVDATIDDALGGSPWDPRHMVRVVIGGGSVDPIMDVDAAKLNAALQGIDDKLAAKPIDASVSFAGGTPQMKAAQVGVGLDFVAARKALQAALLDDDSRVRLSLKDVEPTVTSQDATTFLNRVAQPAVRGPVTISVAHKPIRLGPFAFGPTLRSEVVDGELSLAIDSSLLYSRSQHALSSLPFNPVNASFGFRNGHPYVIQGRSGVTVSPQDWADAVLVAVQHDGKDRRANATPKEQPPVVNAADLRKLGIETRVGSGTARLSPEASSGKTLIGVNQLDGTIVNPHGNFGFLSAVPSPILAPNESIIGSAIYQAALQAGMSDITRTAHQVQPFQIVDGGDAYVSHPSPDLGFSNPTDYGVYVHAWMTGFGALSEVHVELWSTRVWRVEVTRSARRNVVSPSVERESGRSCQPNVGMPGFTVDVVRTITTPSGQSTSDTTTTTYRPDPVVICR